MHQWEDYFLSLRMPDHALGKGRRIFNENQAAYAAAMIKNELDNAQEAPLCAECEARHWPMQNTLCPATNRAWLAILESRGLKVVPKAARTDIEPVTSLTATIK